MMGAGLLLNFFTTSLPSPTPIFLASKKRRKSNIDPTQHAKTNKRTNFFYPKSSPTPLLISAPTPRSQSPDDALDRVILSLQTARDRGVPVDPSIFSSILDACARARAVRHVGTLRRIIPPRLLRSHPHLSSKLLHFYSSCGLLHYAHQLFDRISVKTKSAFAWNSLISGYVESGLYEDALALYFQMEEDGVEPDRFTFPRALKACAGVGSVEIGQAVYRHAVRYGFATDPFVLNALVDMYAKCGDIVHARQVFDKIKQRDLVTWNSMITGYVRHNLFLQALQCCRAMVRDGISPDSTTISTILSVSASLPANIGLKIHGWAVRREQDRCLSVANSLITMYSAYSKLNQSRIIFESILDKDLVSWNAIIGAHRRDIFALTLFQRMVDAGVLPDQVTFVSLLCTCANLGLVADGMSLFEKMEKYEIRPTMEHYGCMVNLLGRAGLVDEAYDLIVKRMPFDGGPTVWGALLYACFVHGRIEIGEKAAERLFVLEPDNEHNFVLLMRIYVKAGRADGVEMVKKMMSERGLEDDALL